MSEHTHLVPPAAKQESTRLEKHGHVRSDPFFWLKNRAATEVIDYLKQENEYTEQSLSHLKDLRTKLVSEMKARIKKTDASVPFKQDDWMYYIRYEQEKEYPIYCRRKIVLGEQEIGFDPKQASAHEGPQPGEEILIDVNVLAQGFSFYHIGDFSPSHDHKLFAFAADTKGRRIYDIYFKDLSTGQILTDKIEKVAGNFEWASDNKTIFYTAKDFQTLRCDKIYRHVLGTPSSRPKTPEEFQADEESLKNQEKENKKKDEDKTDSEDEDTDGEDVEESDEDSDDESELDNLVRLDPLIYFESDDTFDVGIELSRDNKWLFLVSTQSESSEYQFLCANDPEGNFTVFHPRETKHEYRLIQGGDRFFILTNYQAKNFRLVESPDGEVTNKDSWKEVIPHREDVLLEGVEIFKDFIVVQEKQKGQNTLRVLDRRLNDYKVAEEKAVAIKFDEPAYDAYISTNAEFDTPWMRYRYESLQTPASTFDYHMDTGKRVLKKQQEVVDPEFDPGLYQTERLWAPSRVVGDKEEIPISLVYRKDKFTGKKGISPLLLYGYGSYGLSSDPWFSSDRLSLLNRGFVFAIAHIRGGEELGRYWYEDGKLLKKRNTFDDFNSCAEFLIQQGFTNPAHLYAYGGSAGGLLIGAAVTVFRPDLYNGAIADVPFVDIVTTMLDSTIPLTTGEYDEWGNPNNKEFYDYILSYSPYDNVPESTEKFPHLLVLTGLHDSQVQYWEPAKWVAKLRAAKSGWGEKARASSLYLKTDMEVGHGGASGRFKRLEDVALKWAFYLALEDIKD